MCDCFSFNPAYGCHINKLVLYPVCMTSLVTAFSAHCSHWYCTSVMPQSWVAIVQATREEHMDQRLCDMIVHCWICYRWYQDCGLGLDVLVWRQSREVRTSRLGLEKNCQRLGLGRQMFRSQPFMFRFRPNCAGHSMQCERALDVVSLCCSYYCSSY